MTTERHEIPGWSDSPPVEGWYIMLSNASEYLVRIYNTDEYSFTADFYERVKGFITKTSYTNGFRDWVPHCKLYYLDSPDDIAFAARIRMGLADG